MSKRQNLSRIFVIVFILFSIAIIAAGVAFYLVLYNRATEDKINELNSIRHLKTNQIVEWRRERSSEARFFFNNSLFLEQAFNYYRKPNAADSLKLNTWFSTIKENHSYSAIILITPGGKEVYRIGTSQPDDYNTGKINKTIELKSPWVDDLNRDPESGFIYLDTYTPLITKVKGEQVFGILIFRIDPYVSFFPQLRSWPRKNETSEAVLVRQEGNEILFLNDVRFRDNTALRLRFPISRKELSAVKAIEGKQGIIQGIDYRGEDVLASAGTIPNTNWILITKIDETEVYKSIYTASALLGILLIAMLAAGGTGLAFLFRRREYLAIQELYRKEQEKLAIKEHYEHLIRHANDIILLMDYTGKIIDANEKAVAVYGYTREEFLSKNISELRAPDVRDTIKTLLDSNQEENLIYESVHLKKNGEPVNVEISFGIIRVNDNKFIQNIIRDISDRKSDERRIKKLNRVYNLISRVNNAIYKDTDAKELYREICDIAVYSGNFKAVGIGFFNAARSYPEIAASAGEDKRYFHETAMLLKKDFRNDGISAGHDGFYIINDIENDPTAAAWKVNALQKDLRSLGVFPLEIEEQSKGFIMFFSPEKNFFDDEEKVLLGELVHNISYAVQVHDKDYKRKAAEEALARNELNFSTVAANLPATIIYIYDRQLKVTSAEGVKYSPFPAGHQVKGSRIYDLLPEGMNFKDEINAVLNGKEFNDEFSKSDRTYSVKMTPVINEAGVIYAGIVIIQDITDKRLSEAALRKSDLMLKSFYNLHNLYLSIVELRGDEIYFILPNKRFTELYSLSAKDIKSKSLRELSGEETHYYWIDIYRNVSKFKRPVSIEISFKREDKLIWVLAEISLLEQADNKNPLFSFTGVDITERKKKNQ